MSDPSHAAGDTDLPTTDTDRALPDSVPPPAGAHRLTRVQWTNMVSDLFDVEFKGLLPPDLRIDGDPALGSGLIGMSSVDAEVMEAAAWQVSSQAVGDAADAERLTGCSLATQPWDDRAGIVDACERAWLAGLLPRAWHRPVQTAELDAIMDVVRATSSDGDRVAGVRGAIAMIVQSPSFLYRVELGEPDPARPGHQRATNQEIAARMAAFLLDAAPDEAMQADADAGLLHDPDVRRGHVVRLLATPRGRAALANYMGDLFRLDELDGIAKDQTLFPYFSDAVTAAMRQDVQALVLSVLLDEGRPFKDLFTTNEAWVTAPLAPVYDVATSAVEPVQVELPDAQRRGGVLGRAALLTTGAHATLESPARRGKLIRTRLLCSPVGTPPAGVDADLTAVEGEQLTLRERLEEHVSNPACSGCHNSIDPIGFAFDAFDAVGHARTLDNGQPIDASGDLDGAPFDDARGLGEALAVHPDLLPCFVMGTLGHATGSSSGGVRLDDFRSLVTEAGGTSSTLPALYEAIVGSDWFERLSAPVASCTADEENTSRACEGACGAGTETCRGGLWQDCSAPAGAFETCDGVDQDCDGEIDDVVAACAASTGPGTTTCTDGVWSDCKGPPPPAERCNGVDDDLDGEIDEDIPVSFLDVTSADLPESYCVDGGPALTASMVCEAAGPALCRAAGCAITGGSFRDVNADTHAARFLCLDATVATVRRLPASELIALQATCSHVTGEQACEYAAASWCADAGLVTGFDTFDPAVGPGLEEVACTPGATVFQSTFDVLSDVSPDCDGVLFESGPPCHDAIHALCRESGFLTGFGPLSVDGADVSYACLGSAP